VTSAVRDQTAASTPGEVTTASPDETAVVPAGNGARVSPITAASNRFVADHLEIAAAIGNGLVDLVGDPDAFVAAVHAGFARLADPTVVAGERMIAPGIGEVIGVRLPLMEAAHKAFRRATRKTSTALILDVADRLMRDDLTEARWFGMWNLERLLATDPERTWQVMRRGARESTEWISIDTLAHPYATGILLDARRWAEIEQLVYSQSRWERRLVGSTLAAMPHSKSVPGGRDPIVIRRGLNLVGQLIGDSEPDVQKALSWVLRTFAALDPEAVTAFLDTEVRTAGDTNDGHRAWVIRDSLPKLPPETAIRMRAALEGIRRAPNSPSTSTAAAIAAAFLATGTASPAGNTLPEASAK
jgi:3-methyladenine DNA glycosylase AlkD